MKSLFLGIAGLAIATCTACSVSEAKFCGPGAPCETPDAMPIACAEMLPCDRESTAPFCVNGYCQGCSNSAQCQLLGEGRNICLRTPPEASHGLCVVCDEQDRQAFDVQGATDECPNPSAAVCDATTRACRACDANEECTSGLCDNGTCVASESITYVSPNGSGTACTRTAPCPTLARGLRAGPLVLAAPGTYNETETIIVDSRHILIFAYGARFVFRGAGTYLAGRNSTRIEIRGGIFDGAGQAPGMLFNNSAMMILDQVEVRDSISDGLQSTGELTLTRSRIVGHRRNGIFAGANTGSRTFVYSSTIAFNGESGISGLGYESSIIGNVIAHNGQSGLNATGARLGLTIISFNTVADNGSGVTCATGIPFTNGIAVGNLGGSQISGCAVSYSAIEGAAPDPANGIVSLVPSFTDALNGDYHLRGGASVAGLADPAADLSGPAGVDIDGHARPMPAGSRADLGADEIP